MKGRDTLWWLVCGVVLMLGCDNDISYTEYTAPSPDTTTQPDPPHEGGPEGDPVADVPCIGGESGVNFGTVGIGQILERSIRVFNCAERGEVEVSSIMIGPQSDEAFFLSEPQASFRLGPGERRDVIVAISPSGEVSYSGTLVVVSDAGVLEIPLQGQGAHVGCPTPVARARVVGTAGPGTNAIDTTPLSTIQFDGSDSPSPDGITAYEWTIVERPADSTTSFVPNNSVVDPQLFLDLAGVYVIELRTFDRLNTPSCETARVSILATPSEDIHIQLVWDTDGTDMDLHFLHPNGRWNQSPYDCHWLNREPNWGSNNRSDDDPSLDIDDPDGFGPENINLNNPEDTVYKVGAHYFSDHARGESLATVRIWLSSVLVFEHRNKPMNDQQFWEVAEIEWGQVPSVEEIDQVTVSFP